MRTRRDAAAAAWAASGAMALTGWRDQAPRLPPGPVMSRVGAAVGRVGELSARLGRRVDVDVATLLAGRAALLGLRRAGRTSANGSCRLLRAHDGWVAVNLARVSDVDAVGAIVGSAVTGNAWEALGTAATAMGAAGLADRAQLLGVPAAVLPAPGQLRSSEPWRVREFGERSERGLDGLVVVDLSSMWAGPVCARVLGCAGARVIKVESTGRPDGARAGVPAFFDWLHAGHESVALDFASSDGRHDLHRLVERADLVIEASRPRAMRQLGIDASQVISAGAGRTWVSITGYGRFGADADRVAFGDDAAVAGGLVAYDDDGGPVFCADAVADPVTGLYAAVGALATIEAGGGGIVDVAMRDVAAHLAAGPVSEESPVVERISRDRWRLRTGDAIHEVAAPKPPPVSGRAPALGEHTARVLAEVDHRRSV